MEGGRGEEALEVDGGRKRERERKEQEEGRLVRLDNGKGK